jgi:PTH2 family peptidyl-tRNA hydrolase
MSDLDRIPPSTTTYVVATAIIAGITGYFIGQGASLGLFSSKEKEGWPNSYNVKVHRGSSEEEGDDEEEEEDSEEEGDGGELADFEGNTEEIKLVLVVRTDLGMTKGICYTLVLASQLSGIPLAIPEYRLHAQGREG